MKQKQSRGFNWTRCGVLLACTPLVSYFLLVLLDDVLPFGGRAPFFVPLLLWQAAVICLIAGAWRGAAAPRYGCLRAAGYAQLDIAVSFVWFALWNPQASWTFFIPLPVLAVLLAAAMFLCFVFSAPPGGR